MMVDSMTPFNLGALIAMYEHKIFTQVFTRNFVHWTNHLRKTVEKPAPFRIRLGLCVDPDPDPVLDPGFAIKLEVKILYLFFL